MTSIDLNSDLGESFGPWQMGDDVSMLEIVTSANIACGFHAGDPASDRNHSMWHDDTAATSISSGSAAERSA